MKLGRPQIQDWLRFIKASWSNYVGIKAPATEPASSFDITLFNALPGSTKAVTIDATGQLDFADLGSGGSVTSVALSGISSFINVSGSPITTSGTISLALANQSANTIFAGPTTGGAAAPAFRSLVYADISALVGTSSNTLAAGNDSRFHTQNTDTGTSSASFQIDNGNSGPRIKNSAGVIELRNAADSSWASLIVQDLTVKGSTFTINSETVTIDDNIIVLNNNATGSPTENAGIEVERGSSTNASILWDESADIWKIGLVGAETQVARVFRLSFVNSDLSTGVLTVTHNLAQQYCTVQVYDNNNLQVIPDDITASGSNACTITLTSFGTLSGTWRVVVTG